ncbi:MAG: cytochrome c [Dokdonella sp.]|nr:cytochrome c [Dokdonella sp.]
MLSFSCLAATEKGDAAEGKTLVYTCAGCHGITGWKNPYPNYHVPKIGGQNYDYLVAALTEYRTGARKHPTMELQGQALSDQEIRDIATYLSGLTP